MQAFLEHQNNKESEMKSENKNITTAKLRSKKITQFLEKSGMSIKHGHALELLSLSNGYDSWNHYSASLEKEAATRYKNCHLISFAEITVCSSMLLYCRAQLEVNPKSYALVFCNDYIFDSGWNLPESGEWKDKIKKVVVDTDCENIDFKQLLKNAAGKILILSRSSVDEEGLYEEGRALLFSRWLDNVFEKLSAAESSNLCIGKFFNYDSVDRSYTFRRDSPLLTCHFKNRKEDWFFFWKGFDAMAKGIDFNTTSLPTYSLLEENLSVHTFKNHFESTNDTKIILDCFATEITILTQNYFLDKNNRADYSLSEWFNLMLTKNYYVAEDLNVRVVDETAISWVRQMSMHEEFSVIRLKKNRENKKKSLENDDEVLNEIIHRNYPGARIVPLKELQKEREGRGLNRKNEGIIKSASAEQVIKKWSNPEFVRNCFNKKEGESKITTAVIERNSRRETVILDLKTRKVIGISG